MFAYKYKRLVKDYEVISVEDFLTKLSKYHQVRHL